MGQAPYRPEPSASEADAELARLAAEGQHRILEAHASGDDTRDRERRIRVALGAHYGTPLRKWCVAAAGIGLLATVLVAMVTPHLVGLAISVCVVGPLVLCFVSLVVEPAATRARVAAERAWATSLPFPVDGYFEVLGAEARLISHLEMTISWTDPRLPPSVDVLRGVFGRIDTEAQVEAHQEAIVIRSGSISGYTGITRSATRSRQTGEWTSGAVYRNTRFVAYVHRLVDEVLLPLHRSQSIARVSLTRD